MEKFKIDNFSKESVGVPFPKFESLGSQECSDIRFQLCSRLSLPTDCTDVELAFLVDSLQTNLSGASVEKGSFDLESVLVSIGVTVCNDVYVNWHHFKAIDEMNVHDLSKHFFDVWYPCSDDIDIFDSSLSWILSIDHEGAIRVAAHF